MPPMMLAFRGCGSRPERVRGQRRGRVCVGLHLDYKTISMFCQFRRANGEGAIARACCALTCAHHVHRPFGAIGVRPFESEAVKDHGSTCQVLEGPNMSIRNRQIFREECGRSVRLGDNKWL